jgi:prepilin-type N-terminal cleavage/methylation domain-containing protein
MRNTSRGFTLTEVMVVMVIAGMVTLGLVGFYLSSQATWMDASSQALAQRDATALVEAIATRARGATSAAINFSAPDSILTFYGSDLDRYPYSFWLSQADSLVHSGLGEGAVDEGPVVPSLVERFSVGLDGSLPVVHLGMLQVRSETGERVQMESAFTLYNVP